MTDYKARTFSVALLTILIQRMQKLARTSEILSLRTFRVFHELNVERTKSNTRTPSVGG